MNSILFDQVETLTLLLGKSTVVQSITSILRLKMQAFYQIIKNLKFPVVNRPWMTSQISFGY